MINKRRDNENEYQMLRFTFSFNLECTEDGRRFVKQEFAKWLRESDWAFKRVEIKSEVL